MKSLKGLEVITTPYLILKFRFKISVDNDITAHNSERGNVEFISRILCNKAGNM